MDATNQETVPCVGGDDYHSTAFNFVGHIAGSVDPRTGMYSATVDLTTGEGNRLRGPSFDFRLAYSALRVSDEGFGKGWFLRMTEVDRRSRMVSLAAGDAYSIETFQPDRRATFADRKIESFALTPGPSLVTAVVEHITGYTEHLFLPGGVGDILRPRRILKSSGEGLTLEWTSRPTGGFGLHRVVDDEGEELIRVEYVDANETNVYVASGGGVMAFYRFTRTTDQLRRVTLTTLAAQNAEPVREEDEAAWTFTFVDTVDRPVVTLLDSVTFPTGIYEKVRCDERALRMPQGAPRAYMPAVIERVQRAVADPARVIEGSSYRYNERDSNFYGYPAVTNWEDAKDQLLQLIGQGAFRYFSEETRLDSDLSTPLFKVKRSYNQFHLLIRETLERGYIVRDEITEYGDTMDRPFSQQPVSFQMPHRITRTLYDSRAPSIRQVTYETSTYDDIGNVLTRFDSATGIREVFTYYPVGGAVEDGENVCPPDPLGIMRRQRTRTVLPGPGGGPVRVTTSRYATLPILARADGELNGRTDYVQVVATVDTVDDGAGPHELERAVRTYHVDQGPWHGCLSTESMLRDGLSRTTIYDYEQDELSLTTWLTHVSHDGIEIRSGSSLQRITGNLVASIDGAGNRIEYRHDPMGRLRAQNISPDVPDYRCGMAWRYQVAMTERWAERIGVTNMAHRRWMDERGNVIRVDRPEPRGELVPVSTHVFDSLGQLESTTEYDIVDDGRDLQLVTRYRYDDFGMIAEIVVPDGSSQHSLTMLLTDPEDESSVIGRTMAWSEAAGERTGWLAEDVDMAGRRRRRLAGRWDGEQPGLPESSERWLYDGLGRCILHESAAGAITVNAWDADGRLTRSELPDGSILQRAYEPGSAADVLTALYLTPAGTTTPLSIGLRAVDGLGRVTREQVGRLAQTWDYMGGAMQPLRRSLASGASLTLMHDARLGEALLSTVLEEAGGDEPKLLACAEYDKLTGFPRSVSSQFDRLDITADALGRLVRQDFSLGDDGQRFAETLPSLSGRDIHKTLPDGSQQSFEYDEIGRLHVLSDGDARITFDYDHFSRIKCRTADALDGSRRLVDTRSYDERGRPSVQSWTFEGVGTIWHRRLELEWRHDNKLAGRQWYDEAGTAVLIEIMDYDIRGRLTRHEIDSAFDGEFPRDEQGNAYACQIFSYDAIDNLVGVDTTLRDGRVDIATFTYDSVDVDRLIGVRHSLPEYPGAGSDVPILYDAGGNVVDDGHGLRLGWDGAGRLAWVRAGGGDERRFRHGPDGRISAVIDASETRFYYYDDGKLTHEISAGNERRYLRTNGGYVAETLLAKASRSMWLLSPDPQGSVVACHDRETVTRAYGAYGFVGRRDDEPHAGYAGEVIDAASNTYILGGRAYSPRLRRFLNPDPASPFGSGGLNRYAYCAGDPVNRIDPSGNSFFDWLVSGAGLLAAIGGLVSTLLAIPTGGASVPAMIAFWGAVGLETIAVAAEIGSLAAGAAGASDIQSALGWVSLGTGLAAFGVGASAKMLGQGAKAAASAAKAVDGQVGNLATPRGVGPSRVSSGRRLPAAPAVQGRIVKPISAAPATRIEYPFYQPKTPRVTPEWHRIENPQRYPRAVHYGADTATNGLDTSAAIRVVTEANPGLADVYLYSGAHGSYNGSNWTTTHRLGANPSDAVSDLRLAGARERSIAHGQSLHLEDIGSMTPSQARAAWARPGIHLHNYCFGAADELLLEMFNRPPVPVYV